MQPEFHVKVSIFNKHRDCERSIFQGGKQLSGKEQREYVFLQKLQWPRMET